MKLIRTFITILLLTPYLLLEIIRKKDNKNICKKDSKRLFELIKKQKIDHLKVDFIIKEEEDEIPKEILKSYLRLEKCLSLNKNKSKFVSLLQTRNNFMDSDPYAPEFYKNINILG